MLNRRAFLGASAAALPVIAHLASAQQGHLSSLVILKAGMVPHPPHQHPEEEIMLVTEGAGEITVEAQAYPVAPGSMMYCSAQRLHGITAGAHGLTFYFYKWRA
jgi:quercetin dioxygenase-like cupin family protein